MNHHNGPSFRRRKKNSGLTTTTTSDSVSKSEQSVSAACWQSFPCSSESERGGGDCWWCSAHYTPRSGASLCSMAAAKIAWVAEVNILCCCCCCWFALLPLICLPLPLLMPLYTCPIGRARLSNGDDDDEIDSQVPTTAAVALIVATSFSVFLLSFWLTRTAAAAVNGSSHLPVSWW